MSLTSFRDDPDLVLAFLSPESSDDPYADQLLFIARKDFEQPALGISVVEACFAMPDAQRADLLSGDAKEILFMIRNFDMGPIHDMAKYQPVGREKGRPFPMWAVTAQVLCTSGEIREVAWDCDDRTWKAPWFNFETGVVAITEAHQA